MEGNFYEVIRKFLDLQGYTDVPVIRKRYLNLADYYDKLVLELSDENFSRDYERHKQYISETDKLRLTERYNKTATLTVRAYSSTLVSNRVLEAMRRIYELFSSEMLLHGYIDFAAVNSTGNLLDISYSFDNERINAYSFEVDVNFPADIVYDIEYIKKAPVDIKTSPETIEDTIVWEYQDE